MDTQIVTDRSAEDCRTPFSLLLVRLKAFLSVSYDPLRTRLSNLGWLTNGLLISTVNGITVFGYVGRRSGFEPDTSPGEVSRPCEVKTSQEEK